MTNENRGQLAVPAQREPARDAPGRRGSSPGRPFRGRDRRTDDECPEGTLSRREPTVEEEAFRLPTVGWGCGGSEASPTEREEEEALLAALQGRAKRTDDDEPTIGTALLSRPSRAGKRARRRKRRLPVPPPL